VTEIDVHFNTADKVNHACRLLRKAVVGSGARVLVTADAATLDAVDAALWQLSPVDFIAHCRTDDAPHAVARSPVLLASSGDAPAPHRQVLLNLGAALPAGFERFERLIDLVGRDDADRQAARARWRHYVERGYAIQRHDFGEAVR